MSNDSIVQEDDLVLVTGASGFIGQRVIENLLSRGFRNLRCLVRPSGRVQVIESLKSHCAPHARLEILRGNLLSRRDCMDAVHGVSVIYHLAAGRGEKAFPDAFMNSVVTTRNLLDACRQERSVQRVVNVSSLAVYSNAAPGKERLLDELSPVEERACVRGDAYSFAKIEQDKIVGQFGKDFGIPHVIVRPGVVYGSGNEGIHGRVGIAPFGLFLHLGGSNCIPFTHVDNCAEAIVLAGLKRGIEGEVFNVVDDDLPSSRKFLRLYKKNVKAFRSIYIPHFLSYLLCYTWERYSAWSEGQLPPIYNRAAWCVYWKRTRYTNAKIKQRLGWVQKVASRDGLRLYFESCKRKAQNA